MSDEKQNSHIVFCFDRDRTVNTSFNGPVPIQWVRKLAHKTIHPVYAIGNQILKQEANIPGVEEMRKRLGRSSSSGQTRRHVRMPARRERVRLAEELHPDAQEFIVVDDVDLSDMNGWNHYFPDDFVSAYAGELLDGVQLDPPR
jgi:hypothetical protein